MICAERSDIRYNVNIDVAKCETEAFSICWQNRHMDLEEWRTELLRKAKRKEINQSELGRQLTEKLGRSIDRAAVNKMLHGERNIKGDEALAISQLTGMPIPGERTSEIPLISWVSAGELAAPESQIPIEDVPLLPFADLGRGEFFALTVEGDSMDRVSPPGSVIVINRRDQTLVSGKSYVFSVRGETTYKRWHADPMFLQPYSTNPTHQPIFVKRKRDLRVIGRVWRTLLDMR